uniref:Uncharacterized protein n=1 Tax=Setaria italica TaxID=4555 RepID=K3Y3Z9_SETIT
MLILGSVSQIMLPTVLDSRDPNSSTAASST